MHFLSCFSFFIYFEKILSSKLYQYWGKLRKNKDFLLKAMTSSHISLKALSQDLIFSNAQAQVKYHFLIFVCPPKTAILHRDKTKTKAERCPQILLTREFYCLCCRLCPGRVQAEVMLDPSYPEDWHTEGGRRLCKPPGYSNRRQDLCLLSYLSWLSLPKGPVGCSLQEAFVNRTRFWLQAPWTHLEGLGLGTTAAVWKNSCCLGMQWGVPVSRLKWWICVCAIVNDISSTSIAATGSNDG